MQTARFVYLSTRRVLRCGTLALSLASCGGGSGPTTPVPVVPVPPAVPPTQYKVGGSVTGLTGTGLRLINNRDNTIDITANGSFVFARTATTGTPYAVTIAAQPSSPAGLCTVTNGTGTVGTTDVTNIVVTCVEMSPVTMRLSYRANNAQEEFLVASTTGDLNGLRFQATVDGARISCCEIWGASLADGYLQPAQAHVWYFGTYRTPYSPGSQVYTATLTDTAGNVVATSTTSGGTAKTNALVNGDASTSVTNGWTVEAGGEVTLRSYTGQTNALFTQPDPLPFERFRTNAGGNYFSTEGALNGGGVLHQRVTVAFPGKSDGTTAVAIGGWLGTGVSGLAELEFLYSGEDLSGKTVYYGRGTLRARNGSGQLEQVHTYGQIPAGTQYIDLTLTLRSFGGVAFADNLYLSVMNWPRSP